MPARTVAGNRLALRLALGIPVHKRTQQSIRVIVDRQAPTLSHSHGPNLRHSTRQPFLEKIATQANALAIRHWNRKECVALTGPVVRLSRYPLLLVDFVGVLLAMFTPPVGDFLTSDRCAI